MSKFQNADREGIWDGQMKALSPSLLHAIAVAIEEVGL